MVEWCYARKSPDDSLLVQNTARGRRKNTHSNKPESGPRKTAIERIFLRNQSTAVFDSLYSTRLLSTVLLVRQKKENIM